jgi:hypothetical protein
MDAGSKGGAKRARRSYRSAARLPFDAVIGSAKRGAYLIWTTIHFTVASTK